MKKWMKVVSTCALVLTLTGCQSGNQSSTNSDDGTVKVGFIGPLTGDYAVYGIGQRNSALLARRCGHFFGLCYHDKPSDFL